MSEGEKEPTRYEFDHPTCKGYGCCGGGSIVEAPQGYGDYVRYLDYMELFTRLAAAEREKERLDYLDTLREPWSRRPMRALTGSEWSIVHAHDLGEEPTIREAIDAARATGGEPRA